jgi:glutaminase
MSTKDKNRAIAHLFHSYGLLYGDVDDVIDRYTKACSLFVAAKELSVMGATLAYSGINPQTKAKAVKSCYVRDIPSVMAIGGFYDGSGEWIYNVGLPEKSGVGGGILAVVPKKIAISVFSPRLDTHGNSTKVVMVLKDLAERWHLHIFE